MPGLVIGFGLLAILFAVAASRRKAPAPRVSDELPPPGVIPTIALPVPAPSVPTPTPPAEPGTLAASVDAVREGMGTAEDFETLAEEAERQGETRTAEQLHQRAAEAPERATVEEAITPPPEPAPLPTAPVTPPPAPVTIEVPAPASEVAPETAPTPEAVPVEPSTGLPVGFAAAAAQGLARAVASDIMSRRFNYDRGALKAFQRAAGIAIDGHYGGGSRGALQFYGIANAPRALFKPFPARPYPEPLASAARVVLA